MLARRRGERPSRGGQAAVQSRAEAPQMGLLFPAAAAAEAVPAARRERKLWSVSELIGVLRGRVEREFQDEWVEGEVSNCRPSAAGHLYFTLKDSTAQLPVVLFRRQAMLLRFKPADGLAVLVKGRLSVYDRGQLQLVAESMEPRGAGALQLAFDQLKAKLRAEGLFDADRKRPLPPYPRNVGVITSPTGAVIRDIVSVCRRRHSCLNLLVYPATVQGSSSADEVRAGLLYFQRTRLYQVDIIIIARGGGSAEDLAGFNDEALARAIAASPVPVVSAVGHETDFTIADFVADLRAPTPSAAAELITASQHGVAEQVRGLTKRLERAVRYGNMQARQRLDAIAAEGVLLRTRDTVGRRQQRVDDLRFRLTDALRSSLNRSAGGLLDILERLRAQDLRRRIAGQRGSSDALVARLRRAGEALAQPGRRRCETAEARLRALSPHAVLERGYALVFLEDGSLLREAHQTRAGQQLTTRLATGTVRSRVVDAM